MATAVPPPYSMPPPCYSQAADHNPQRHLVNNNQVWQVAQPSPQPTASPVVQAQPIPVSQPTFSQQPVPYPQAYSQLIQYQQPFMPTPYPYKYPYPLVPGNMQPYQTPVSFYRQPQVPYQQRPVFYPATPQAVPAIPLELAVPPPPEGYVLIPGTNYAVPGEWMSKKFEKSNTKKERAKVPLPVLYGLKTMLGT
ncbi:hypothetical protein BDZ45DRAFT_795506 [Acephala macrosclerotiorum]|nr:hypothetical protein BDZ45DRAFT_795506 [Acephala macrosclerotiorum]